MKKLISILLLLTICLTSVTALGTWQTGRVNTNGWTYQYKTYSSSDFCLIDGSNCAVGNSSGGGLTTAILRLLSPNGSIIISGNSTDKNLSLNVTYLQGFVSNGVNGTNGVNGSNGTGIVAIYVLSNGSLQINLSNNINTTSQNLSVKGDTGATGATGATGPAGNNGSDGLNATANWTLSNGSTTVLISNTDRVNITAGRNVTITQVGSQLVINAVDTDTNSGGTSNLTLAQVNTNMGNYSNNSAGYYNVTTLPAYPTADNTSWNETLATTLYLGIAATATNSNQLGGQVASYFLNSTGGTYDNQTWNQTKANTLYAPISTISYNNSWNETLADTLYYDINLNKQGFYNSSTLPASLGINSGGWLNTTSLVSLANNNTNVSIGSLNSLPVVFFDNTNGYVGFGTRAMTSTNHWYFNTSADSNKVLLINNGDVAGLNTAAVLRVQTAGAVLNFQAHGPSRTISRWGVTLANWSEFLSNSPSDGLAIGTTIGPLILGTTSTAAIYINETTQNIGFGATTTPEKLTVTGNISTTSSVIVGGGVLRIPSSASAPSDTTNGAWYYDTTNNDAVCVRVNGAWVPLTNATFTCA